MMLRTHSSRGLAACNEGGERRSKLPAFPTKPVVAWRASERCLEGSGQCLQLRLGRVWKGRSPARKKTYSQEFKDEAIRMVLGGPCPRTQVTFLKKQRPSSRTRIRIRQVRADRGGEGQPRDLGYVCLAGGGAVGLLRVAPPPRLRVRASALPASGGCGCGLQRQPRDLPVPACARGARGSALGPSWRVALCAGWGCGPASPGPGGR